MTMSFDILLDLFVILCLAVTIGFAWRLNKRLSIIYKSRDELQNFMIQFSASMEKADTSIKDLRSMGESVFKTAQNYMKTADELRSDLMFLNERGEKIAQSLDDQIRLAREFLQSAQQSTTHQQGLQGHQGDLQGNRNSDATTDGPHRDRSSHAKTDVVHHLKNVR